MSAIQKRRPNIIELLVKNGADPDVVSLGGLTRGADDPDLIRWALEAGVDPSQRDPETHRTALHEAATYGYIEAAKVLVEAGAGLRPKDKWGKEPLEIAEQNGHWEIASVLK